jgi:hypothetical protein
MYTIILVTLTRYVELALSRYFTSTMLTEHIMFLSLSDHDNLTRTIEYPLRLTYICNRLFTSDFE